MDSTTYGQPTPPVVKVGLGVTNFLVRAGLGDNAWENVEFAKQFEQQLGRPIRPRKGGRKPAGISDVRKLGN
jgi:hypothetical protein